MVFSFPKKISETTWVAFRAVLSYLLCIAAFYFNDKSTTGGAETRQLGILPYVIITTWFIWIFFHNRILIRTLAFRKKNLLYIISLVSGITVVSLIQRQVSLSVIGTTKPFGIIALTITYYTLLGALIFLAFEFLRHQKLYHQVNSLKKEMELQQLKSQLHPHFLFNALNNIYSYNIENSKHGNDLILKLGQLMRFIIELSNREHIPLRDEIDFIENYVAFEKERLGDRCTVLYENHLSHNDKIVAPLLLFPFVENAFKHGANSIRPTHISILIKNTSNTIMLVVKNQITAKVATSTQTGLSNIVRRLELLYPGKHTLHTDVDADTYTVKLKITL